MRSSALIECGLAAAKIVKLPSKVVFGGEFLLMTVWRLSLGNRNRLNRLIRRWTILGSGLRCRDRIKDI
jgi:hypothetical protein